MNASAIFIFSPTSFLCLVVIEIEANIHTQNIITMMPFLAYLCPCRMMMALFGQQYILHAHALTF